MPRTTAALTVGLVLVATGCSSSPTPARTGVTTPGAPSSLATGSAAPSATASVATAAMTTPGATSGAALASAVAALEKSSGRRLSVAVTTVGVPATTPVWHTGTLGTQVAWSTSKVPVALAVLRGPHRDDARARTWMRQALTASDNEAAENLYALLGTPAQAAAATQAVIRQEGDRTTTVPTTRARSDYTIFGQTRWSGVDQARFVARLPCHPDAAPVLQLMGQVVADQRWGLGTIPGARFKGGWGPTTTTGQDVRQMGVVTVQGHQYGIAIGAVADTQGEGQQLLTQLAKAVQQHPVALPETTC